MTLTVVYNGIGKLAAEQLKKLVSQRDDQGKDIIGSEDGTIKIVALDEPVFIDTSKANTIDDPIVFVDDIKSGQDIMPIAQPKQYGFGVTCSFAGPQLVLTIDPKALRGQKEYIKFLEKLNSLTFQQLPTAPRGIDALKETLMHGLIGRKRREENVKKQQLIYGVTKLYYEDLREFMLTYGKDN